MKKTIKLLLVCLLIISLFSVVLAACDNNANTDASDNAGTTDTTPTDTTVQPVEITDMVGRKMNVTPASYSKVVCIGAGALRLYSYIGDTSKLAGVEDIENETLSVRPKMFDKVARPYVMANKEVFQTLPSCGVGGPNNQAAEAEKILLCDPDIVISEYEDVDKENALQEQLGVPVVTVKYGAKGVFDTNVQNSLTLLGKIFGKESKATALNAFIESEKTEIYNRTKDIPENQQKTAYICGLGNWGTTNHLMTAQNYEPMNVAHIKNVITDLASNGIQAIDNEKFVSIGANVDIMIIDAAAGKNITYTDGMFDHIKAWQDGEVYLEMAYNAYYTNLEIALANTWFMAKSAYPDKFSDIDMTAKTNQITQAFLGKDMVADISACAMSYGGYQKINTATFFA